MDYLTWMAHRGTGASRIGGGLSTGTSRAFFGSIIDTILSYGTFLASSWTIYPIVPNRAF